MWHCLPQHELYLQRLKNLAGNQHQHGSQSRLERVRSLREERAALRASGQLQQMHQMCSKGKKPGRRCQTAPRELIEIANMVFQVWERMHSSDRRTFGDRRKYLYIQLKEAGFASSNNVGRSSLSLVSVPRVEDTVAALSAQDESSPGEISNMEAGPVSVVRPSIVAQVSPVHPKLDLSTSPTWGDITQPHFDSYPTTTIMGGKTRDCLFENDTASVNGRAVIVVASCSHQLKLCAWRGFRMLCSLKSLQRFR